MELKGKKVLVFGAGKSGIGAADLLNAVGACPVLYDGKADLDKESVLHKISGNYELPIYAGELPKEVQESLDLVVLSPGVPTDLPIVKGFYDQHMRKCYQCYLLQYPFFRSAYTGCREWLQPDNSR